MGSIPRLASLARRGVLSSLRFALTRSGRFRGRHGFPGRPTATVARVGSRRVTSSGEAASRYAPNGGPRAIDQHQPLRTLALLGRADFGAPFVAGIQRPLAKHSSQRSLSRSCPWAQKVRQRWSSTPRSSPCVRRRQPVLERPSRWDSSRHGAPVQRIPSKQRR
jgi:hypothetical protein